MDDNELKFGGEDGDDGDDDSDEDDDFEPTTQEITTTTRKLTTSTSTTTTTTKRPPVVAVGTEPPGILEGGDEDAFHNMFKPGILAGKCIFYFNHQNSMMKAFLPSDMIFDIKGRKKEAGF